MIIDNLRQKFLDRYGVSDQEVAIYFSPGRVNLIGEHTDYNGGYVLPSALSYGTYLAVRLNADSNFKLASENQEFSIAIPQTDVKHKVSRQWVNYPLGVLNEFLKKEVPLRGLDMLYEGNIPNGAGLSSSASVELVTATAINDLFNDNKLTMVELSLMSQSAENNFVGVNCGIMDQFAVAMGQASNALFLNCDTLDYDLVPVHLDGYKLVISNTNKPRKLADSKYNERRSECEKAVEHLSKDKTIKNLSQLSLVEFEAKADLIPDEVVRRRARHVISENQRVLDAVAALREDRLTDFGQLMNASHDSLRDDYEVTGIELDTLVEEARKIDGVLGSRMTGAGFGGCTVSVVEEGMIDDFRDKVAKNYQQRTGLVPDFYIADVGDGAKRLI